MRVRLWRPWLGPDGWVPAGEEVEASAADGAAICQAGHGEIVGPTQEVAALVVPEHAVAVTPRRASRRKAKKRR
jgi:hypothetical protein